MSLLRTRCFSTALARAAAARPATAPKRAPRPAVRKPTTVAAAPQAPTWDDLAPTPPADPTLPTSLPTPSPPLSALPDENYSPLPTAQPPAQPPAQPSTSGTEMADSYVLSRLPGEMPALDWTTSFRGLSERPFDKDARDALLRPLDPEDVEMKPDGLLYLPEIKYRRTLNAAFGPGGWGMAPRGETHVGPRIVSREWGLVCLGRLVSIARGEQEYFDPSGVPTATEACKSNALMRCCKDLGIASELWDPRFIREFKAKHCVEVMVEHVVQKKKRKLWRRKDAKFDYPYKEIGPAPK